MTRTVHNISAKYNGYFNANELIKETKSTFLYERVEDYSQILPLYPLPSLEESKNWYAPMDTAIRKCELVIVKNRMPNVKKGRNRYKEWCKWIDDNWMTIGIAQYYKKDFSEALNTFKYVKNHYPLEKSFYESQFWEAKVLIEMNAFEEAEEALINLISLYEEQNNLEEEEEEEKKLTLNEKIRYALNYDERKEYLENNGVKITESLVSQIYPTLSDLYLKSNQIEEAKKSLGIAINSKQKKDFQSRMVFILAQLYHKEGDIKASQLYNEVIEMNPEYEMAFQAKINRALSFSDGDTKAIRNQLLKMLKDDKNIDFYDQIYYALAEIAFKKKKEDLAVEYLHLSINTSKSNKTQKVKSLIGLADWFYDTKKYKSSFLYFDTASAIIDKKDQNYLYVNQKHKILNSWNKSNTTIIGNDSILNLCNMSESELTDVILDYIDKLEKAKEKAKEKEVSYNTGGLNRLPSISSPSSTMFFWDENLKGIGYNEFQSLWGDRKLEDNWRRSIKSNFSNKEELSDSTLNAGDGISVDFLISQLPCGDNTKIDSININVLNALFELGILHHYQIIDLNESIKNFNRIINQFQPEDKSIAALYELYLIYETKGNNTLKNEIKDTLIIKYPNSKYSKLLLDPSSNKEQEESRLKEEQQYSTLFEEYKKGEYVFVFDQTKEKLKDSLNPFYCEYALLNAYAYGKTNAGDSLNFLIKKLKRVSKNCKGSDPGEYADEILMVLLSNKSENQQNENGNIFSFNPKKTHSFLLFAPKGSIDLNKSKNKIADFNKTSFSKDQLKTKSVFLNTSDQMILVENFKNLNDAMDYYTAFKVNKGGVSDLQNQKYFVITQENLTKIYLQKNIKKYEIFFKDFYILD